MSDTNEAKVDMDALGSLSKGPCPAWSRRDVMIDLAYERQQISDGLERLEYAIKANPEGVSDHHKDLWRKQAEAMRAYKEVLGERIKDLIDNG